MFVRRNPQLNTQRRADPPAVDRGPAARRSCTHILDTAGTFLSVNDREVKKVPLLRGKSVFNLFFENSHAHPHHLRDRRQAAVGRRHQPRHRALVARPRARACSTRSPTCRRCMPTCSWCATRESGAPYLIAQHCAPHVHVVNAGDGRHCASDAGPARHVHDPPLQEGLHQAHGGDRRRHRALARRALRHPRADDARRARDPRGRPEDAGAGRPEARWACASATTWPRASAAPT